LWLDISVPLIFERGSADIKPEQVPLLTTIINTIKNTIPANSVLEVAGYTDDAPLEGGKFANNWELSSMQTARVASLLIDSGIDPKTIHITSYAGNAPIVPNLDAYGKPILKNRVRNQRIMIKVEMAQEKEAGS
jgi:chemotaxis protein MotB